jgi:hypothetical protein
MLELDSTHKRVQMEIDHMKELFNQLASPWHHHVSGSINYSPGVS